jgi:hypothetical protein
MVDEMILPEEFHNKVLEDYVLDILSGRAKPITHEPVVRIHESTQRPLRSL